MPYKLKIKQDQDISDSPRDWDNLGTMVCWHNRYDLGDEQRRDDVNDWLRELAESLDPTLYDRIEYWENGDGWTRLYNAEQAKRDAAFDEINADLEATILGHTPGASDAHIARLNKRLGEWILWSPNYHASVLSDEKIKAAILAVIDREVIMLPLYLYDHGGITMNVGGYSCPWDSGQVGYIYVTRADVLKEFSAKRLTKELRAKAERILRQEVKTYAQFLEGDVYGYVIYEIDEECYCEPLPWNNYPPCDCCDDAEVVDSYWGYYGSNAALDEGQSMLKYYTDKE